MPAGALLGAKVAAYWDPAIAIALSLWVVWVWGGQAQQHLLNLVGRAAPPDLLQRLTYLAFYHDERVQKIDTVRWVQGRRWGGVCRPGAACGTCLVWPSCPHTFKPPLALCMMHCSAFTLGNSYIAEVDIVLPPLMSVREAHDIGEALTPVALPGAGRGGGSRPL